VVGSCVVVTVALQGGRDNSYNYGNLTGLGVNIYIMDTGVFLGHAEFGGPAGPSRAKWGADCTSGTCLTAFPPADARAASGDCQGHGTHCAGIAAGRCGCGVALCGHVCACVGTFCWRTLVVYGEAAEAGAGIAPPPPSPLPHTRVPSPLPPPHLPYPCSLTGVAKQATIYAVRVLDCAGSGYDSSIIAGIDWVVKHSPTTVRWVAHAGKPLAGDGGGGVCVCGGGGLWVCAGVT
jgi:subtilisin family serine protease